MAAMCNREITRALRGSRDSIVREWQAQSIARLWHLDRRLFARKGAVSLCMSATLSCLIGLVHEDESLVKALPDPGGGADSPASDVSSGLESCASMWADQALSWADVRSVLDSVDALLLRVLTGKSIAPAGIAAVRCALTALTVAIADIRVRKLEHDL